MATSRLTPEGTNMNHLALTQTTLTFTDQKYAGQYMYSQDISLEIKSRLNDPSSTAIIRRQMSRIQALPNAMIKLTHLFRRLVQPVEVKLDILWGLIYLNLRMSYTSLERLKRTCDLLDKLRKVTALFIRCVEGCDEDNEARIAVIDFLDPIVTILTDCVVYFHRNVSGTNFHPSLYSSL